MQLFLSTTFHGEGRSDLKYVLDVTKGLDIDGIELGSTHYYNPNIEAIVRNSNHKRLVSHNFFPPAKDQRFVINIASADSDIRKKSIEHVKHCINVAALFNVEVYSLHPGFLADASVSTKNGQYDFEFGIEKSRHESAFQLMLDAISELCEWAATKGVLLAVETEGSLTKQRVLLMETVHEFDRLFCEIPNNLYLNLNLAHSRFAAKLHDFSVENFIERFFNRIAVVEISHNNGEVDQHLPLIEGSYVFNFLDKLPDVPLILEFRNTTKYQVQNSISLMRAYSSLGKP